MMHYWNRMGKKSAEYTRIMVCMVILLVGIIVEFQDCSQASYTIQGTEVSWDSADAPAEKGCWQYANNIYDLIWGIRFETSFEGNKYSGSNLLRNLDDEERLFTVDHAEIFIKSSVPGAAIRLTNALHSESRFESDGLQSDGTYGHNIIIAKIYDEGFVAFENVSSGSREKYYTWQEFYDTWSGVENTAKSHYKFFKYIKWPDAPALKVDREGSTTQKWMRFWLMLLVGALLFAAGSVWARFYAKSKQSNTAGETALKLFVCLFPVLAGGFFAWGSGVATLYLSILLVWIAYKTHKLYININEQLLLTILLPTAFFFVCFWAVDGGQALFGVLKFLPLPLFVMVIQQLSEDARRRVLYVIPWSAAGMLLLSGVLCFVPILRSMLIIDGRLAGFFQYPNTWALYLLVACIVVSFMPKQKNMTVPAVLFGILFIGIILSGSRTVFVLAVAAFFLRALMLAKGKQRTTMLVCMTVILGVVLAAAWALPNTVLGRYLHISLASSTLLGRLLYYQDAILVILRHPFGLGYMGYYYSQGSFQTGVYSAMYVHNDLLQIFLDVGWLPAVAAMAVMVRQLWCRKLNREYKLILFVILAHSMFDFSLQFLAVWFVLLLVMDGGHSFWQRECTHSAALQTILLSTGILFSAIAAALGTASFLETYLSYDITLKWYPNDVPALMQKLAEASDGDEMNETADKLLKLDDKISFAHSAKAAVYYSYGDIKQMAEQKALAIDCARYDTEEYQDYAEMLITASKLYQEQGDSSSTGYCVSCLQETAKKMEEVLAETNPLAWKIKDKPELTFTDEQQEYISCYT